MSASSHFSWAAAARKAARSICRCPSTGVSRVERCTGTQRVGSAQSQTVPLAHGSISCCSMTTVGTCGTAVSLPSARSCSAATAASAAANQVCTRPA
eukprot:6212680-Pleurochrysis_carterae.AAC.2